MSRYSKHVDMILRFNNRVFQNVKPISVIFCRHFPESYSTGHLLYTIKGSVDNSFVYFITDRFPQSKFTITSLCFSRINNRCGQIKSPAVMFTRFYLHLSFFLVAECRQDPLRTFIVTGGLLSLQCSHSPDCKYSNSSCDQHNPPGCIHHCKGCRIYAQEKHQRFSNVQLTPCEAYNFVFF